MKSDFHFHFYSRIVIMAVLAVSLFLIQKSVTSTAEITDYPYPIGGWAWSSAAGWLSLNCYNDFDTPGTASSTCEAVGGLDYGLEVDTSGNVEGCIWAGNALSGAGAPLGWVCFSDQDLSNGPNYAVVTSTTHLNALASTTFASIISQEDWRCSGGADDGISCYENANCASGNCAFAAIDNEAWKLGFPIASPADADDDAPSADNPLEGCFNCYEEYEYACSIDRSVCIDDSGCLPTGDPAVAQTCSVITAVNKNCENCLEYFYYPGQCDNSGGDGSHTSCQNADDCTVVSETCEEISTCYYNIESACEILSDCTQYGTCSGGSCTLNPSISCISDLDCVNSCISRPTGSLKKLIGAYNCSECTIENYNNVCGINTYQGNINSCDSCVDTYYSPGVMLDHKYYNLDVGNFPPADPNGERASLCGWGWNAWEEGGPTYGLGWFQFGPRVVTSTKPYLSVDGGNIYSRGSITGKYLPPFGHYNASYLIESGGSITNFVSSSTLAGIYQGEFPYRPMIDFFSLGDDGKYSNALGEIDRYGLITDFSGAAALGINKYGSDIRVISSVDFEDNTPRDGAIHHYQPSSGSVTVEDPITVPRGTDGLGRNAAGIIWVEGDLIINENIEYDLVGVENLISIPSLVWVIEGDLKINYSVTDLAGAFIVLGDGNSCAFTPPDVPDPHCGQIITCVGNTTDCAINPLTISGNVMAKYFDLGRYYIDPATGQAAESFINDGRLQANPPPGFEDFSSVIPRFSDY